MESRSDGRASQELLAGLKKVFDRVEIWNQQSQNPWPSPARGSSLYGDNRETAPYQIGHAVTSSLVGALDHIHALSVLIQKGGVIPARAPYTILRGALENASMAAWVLQPASRNERILRRLRLEWTNISYRAKVMKIADPSYELEPERKQKLLDIGIRRGFTEMQMRLISSKTQFGQIVREAAAAIEDTPEDVAEILWNECSGVAHGQTWAVLASADHERLRENAEGVLNLHLTISDDGLLTTTLLVGLIIGTAWNLRAERGIA